MIMSRANEYTWEDLGQVVGPQGPAGPAGGGSIVEKKDFSGGSYDPISGQYTNKTKDQILNEVYTETDNGTNPKEYYGGISGVGDEALKEMFGVNDVAPNSMNYVDYHKDVKFDGKATEYGNSPYTNTFLFAVKSGGNTTIYDSSDKTKRQCVVINGTVTASTTTMQELVVGTGGATVTLKDGENSTIPYVVNGATSESGAITLNEGDIIHIKEYSEGTNYYNNAYQNVPYFMSSDTNCISDYLSDGLFAAPSGENGAISNVMVMAGGGIINYTEANYSYQKEYKFTCRYSDPNYNQKCVEATYGYATWDSTLHADKLNPVKNEMPENYTVLNLDYSTATGDLMLKLVGDIANYDNICGYVELPNNADVELYHNYLYGDVNELQHFCNLGQIVVSYNYINYKKYKNLKDTILEIIFTPGSTTASIGNESIIRKFVLTSGTPGIERIDSKYVKKPLFKTFEMSSSLTADDILNYIFDDWTGGSTIRGYDHLYTNLKLDIINGGSISNELRLERQENYGNNITTQLSGTIWAVKNDMSIGTLSKLGLDTYNKVDGILQKYDTVSNTYNFVLITNKSQLDFRRTNAGSLNDKTGTIYLCLF